jgi:DNA-binding NtrC family response regulator
LIFEEETMNAQKKVIELQAKIDEKAVRSKILKEIIYNDPKIINCLSLALRVAVENITVLIWGESGVGKENLARLICEQSHRNGKELFIVNCGALARELIPSLLFGHRKGAYTGAHEDKEGYFEMADGATLFLDEIGELPLDVQANLLRVLEDGTYTRVGETTLRRTNARIIAATNKNLSEMVAGKKFREDLFYRLNQFPIHIPPLREIPDDIPLLVNHFKDRALENKKPRLLSIPQKTMDLMMSYPWPGNIRELKNVIEKAIIISDDSNVIQPEHLQLELETIEHITINAPSISGYSPTTLNEHELVAICLALHCAEKKEQAGAANILGVSRRTISYKIKAYGIDWKNPLANIEHLRTSNFSTDAANLRILELEEKIEGFHLAFKQIEIELEKRGRQIESLKTDLEQEQLENQSLTEKTKRFEAKLKKEISAKNVPALKMPPTPIEIRELVEVSERESTDKERQLHEQIVLLTKQLGEEKAANRRTETLGIEEQILELAGASEFKKRYPQITLGQTTLSEAMLYGRVAN